MGSQQQMLLGVTPAGAGAPFGDDPLTIPNLELWLDAYQLSGLSEDQVVSPWPDMSGNGRDGTHVRVGAGSPIGAIYKGTGGPNGQPAVRMVAGGGGSTNGGYYTLANFMTGFTSGHVFEVLLVDSNAPSGYNISPGAGNWTTDTNSALYPFGTGNLYDTFGTSARKNNFAPGVSLTTGRLYERRTASAAWSAYLDGTSKHSTGTNTVAWSTAPWVGRNAAGYLQGLLSELIFYSRVLSAGEITTIKDYIAAKYALTIA